MEREGAAPLPSELSKHVSTRAKKEAWHDCALAEWLQKWLALTCFRLEQAETQAAFLLGRFHLGSHGLHARHLVKDAVHCHACRLKKGTVDAF